MVKKYTIASMWNCLLAAMLMVGRKARLLRVGRRSLATREPIEKDERLPKRGKAGWLEDPSRSQSWLANSELQGYCPDLGLGRGS